jgi:hypothetical protein
MFMSAFFSVLIGAGKDAEAGGEAGSQLQLLDLDETEEVGDGRSAGMAPEVDVNEEEVEAVEARDMIEEVDLGRVSGRLGRSPKVNLVLAPVGSGLIRTGDSVFRKSR